MSTPTDPQPTDKLSIRDLINSIRKQFIEADELLDKQYGAAGYEGASADFLVKGWPKPMKLADGTVELWIDFNEPSKEPMIEVPIPIRRIPRVPPKAAPE
jgi:hypothetical protein